MWLMGSMESEIEKILGPGGKLAQRLEGFEVRESQIEMARLIARALEDKVCAVVEAGTGTGKTLGYLVPIVLSGKKAVVSTGTKNLQEQIFRKDIHLLSDTIGSDIDVVMMKGRKNYLCLYRYHQFTLQPSLVQDQKEKLKQALDAWIQKTEFADRSELSCLREDDPVWEALSCSSEQCLGLDCMFYNECFLNRLRSRAAEARLIIVNHHLFFADLKVKKTGFAEIIPRFQVAVFDEAHDVEEIAVTYFGETLSTRQLIEFATDVQKELEAMDKGAGRSLNKPLDNIRSAAEELRGFFFGRGERGPVEAEELSAIRNTVGRKVLDALKAVGLFIEENRGESLALPGLAVRAQSLAEKIDEVTKDRDSGWLVWFEQRKKSLVMHASPLDISQQMKDSLFDRIKSVIFTSATISTGGTFGYIRSRLGIEEDALEGLYPSHFDFSHQALMYIPNDLPLPADNQFPFLAAQRISDILELTSGRALVLFTSYQNLNIVFEALQDKLPFSMYRQGDVPRSALLAEFSKDIHSVLFATGSFWQGVDVPGEALSCLIIDKLPFDSPTDPIVAARIKAIRARGGNPFIEYQVPSAIISLRQGLGRLIRKRSDRGVMAILDKRILTHKYGEFFLKSLPPIPITNRLEDIGKFFEKESTTRDSGQ